METTKLSRLVGGRPFEETLQFVDSEFESGEFDLGNVGYLAYSLIF